MTLLKKNQMEKITSKNTNRALRDTNADKTTVLLSHLKTTILILQYTAASPTHTSYLQYKLALIRCSDVTRGMSQGETQLKGAHWLTLRKQLRNTSKSDIQRLYKNPKSPENTPKNAKKQQSTETKRIVDTKIQSRQGPSFQIQLGRLGAVRTPATRQLCH